MSLHTHHHVFDFLRNKEMNLVYISYGLMHIALGFISVFVPIYLLNIGYSISYILFFFFIVSISFLVFSFPSAKIVSHYGPKHSMLIAMGLLIVYFLGLRLLPDYPSLFFILPVIRSWKMTLYNYSFHLNFVKHSDRKNVGKEVSLTNASAIFASSIAPFIGGLTIAILGFSWLFIIGSILLVLAIAPLFLTPDTHEKISFTAKNLLRDVFSKKQLPLLLSFGGYAIESWIGFILWPIFLFLVLDNYESVGAIFSFTLLLTIIIFFFAGTETDKGNKSRLLSLGTILYAFGWIGRIFVTSFGSIFFMDTYKSLTQNIVRVPWSAYSYDLASRGDCFKFIVERELMFNIVRILVIPIIMILFALDFFPFVTSFAIAAIASFGYMLINRYETK